MEMFGLGFKRMSSAVSLRMKVNDVIANYNWPRLIDGLRS